MVQFVLYFKIVVNTFVTAVSINCIPTAIVKKPMILVMAANTAEMGAGSGIFLSVGRVDFQDGRLQLADFEPSGSLHLDVGGPAVA